MPQAQWEYIWRKTLERFLKDVKHRLFQQNEASGKVNKGQKGTGQLIISGSDTPEIFEFEEEALHKMALLV